MPVTTRIITFLVGNPNLNLHLPQLLGGGTTQVIGDKAKNNNSFIVVHNPLHISTFDLDIPLLPLPQTRIYLLKLHNMYIHIYTCIPEYMYIYNYICTTQKVDGALPPTYCFRLTLAEKIYFHHVSQLVLPLFPLENLPGFVAEFQIWLADMSSSTERFLGSTSDATTLTYTIPNVARLGKSVTQGLKVC